MAFNFNPVNGLLDTNTFPTNPGSETEARQQFMELFNQLKNQINEMQNHKLTADDGGVKGTATDLNSITNSGIWYIDTSTTNKPFAYGYVEVFKVTWQHVYQRAYQITGNIKMAIRRSSDGGATWTAWKYDNESFQATGYLSFQNGLILQWGSININITPESSSATNVVFPIAFPTTVFGVFPTPLTGYSGSYFVTTDGNTSTGFSLRGSGPEAATLTAKWLALGY